MRRRYIKLGLLAAEAARREPDQRHFMVGAAAIRGDGVLVSAGNGPAQSPCSEAHAEVRLCAKLDYGAEVLVVRVRKSGGMGCAKPCKSCENALRWAKVKRVWYTDADGEVKRLW